MMAAALALKHLGISRRLWLYDTFEGMSAPADMDRTAHTGEASADIMARVNQNSTAWCRSGLDEVTSNVASVADTGDVRFKKGEVEKTIPKNLPDEITRLPSLRRAQRVTESAGV
jgi:hypothetical protein